ncbi:MAG: carboxypeptidase regulatory-like domain-containing protein, partial [Terriglobia bacterium]
MGYRRAAWTGVLLMAALVWLAPRALAQTGTGQVNGTITDPSGAAMPGAKVTLINQDTRIANTATANQSGSFVFINVLPGQYTLQVAATGFETASVPSFVVAVRQVVVRDVTLTLGAVTQTVQVKSVAPLLQPSSTQLGTVINEKAVHDLPLNGRNFMELLLLTPGATPISTAQGGSNSGGTPDGGVTTMPGSVGVRPSFQGSQNRSAVYFEDGIINTDFRDNAPGVMPNPDEIQEFTAESHDSRADNGGVIGGTVNIDTKSGTNQFHGSGFEFVRNNAFDARNTFTDKTAPAPYRQNQFGATLGGPIQHDKTFFFIGYSGWRYSKPSQSFSRLPTAQELAGNFSGNQQANAGLGLAASGFGDTLPIYNPYSTAPDPNNPGSYTRQPFMCLGGTPLPVNANKTQTAIPGSTACNIIPSSLINPAMQKLLTTYIDVPNLTGNPSDNFIENQASTNSENDGLVRVDRRFGNRDTAFFRYEEQWDSAISGATPKTSRPTSYYYHTEGGGWTHTFKPNLILDVRGGNLSGPVNSYNISALGVKPEEQFFNDIPRFSSMDLDLSSPYSGLANILPNVDNFRNNPGWNISADVNWFKGNHN